MSCSRRADGHGGQGAAASSQSGSVEPLSQVVPGNVASFCSLKVSPPVACFPLFEPEVSPLRCVVWMCAL